MDHGSTSTIMVILYADPSPFYRPHPNPLGLV